MPFTIEREALGELSINEELVKNLKPIGLMQFLGEEEMVHVKLWRRGGLEQK